MTTTHQFVTESNAIEGITRNPTDAEIVEHDRFVALSSIAIADLVRFVEVYEPAAMLREDPGMNVRVGSYCPPHGGPKIPQDLEHLLMFARKLSAYELHIRYEQLHPFTDCNGRSGRALWAWRMKRKHPLGFLHHFYYQALSAAQAGNK